MPLALAIGAVGSGIAGAVGASKAAGAQSKAVMSAAELERQSAQEALAENKRQFDVTQTNIAPWLTAGKGALTNLSQLLGIGGDTGAAGFGSLMKGWDKSFQAPTDVTEQNDPGYKFRLDQGLQALQNSAAAKGGLLSGGTARAVNDYAQSYASGEYSNVYGRAFGEYQQQYNQFQQNQANQFNRLSAVSGGGQTAAGELGQFGADSSRNIANILLGSAGQQGQALQNAGAARASGYAGIANSLGGVPNDIASLLMLNKLLNPTAPTAPGATPPIFGG